MKVNVGSWDRLLRVVVGLALVTLAAMGQIGWWGWLGLVPLATGLFRFCPAYTLLGVNTCPVNTTAASGGADRTSDSAGPKA